MTKTVKTIISLAVGTVLSGGAWSGAAQPDSDINNPKLSTATETPGAAAQAETGNEAIVMELNQVGHDPKTAPEKLFLFNAAIDSMSEVQLAQEAQAKAESADVKKLADQLVRDHEALNEKLKDTARQMNMDVPDSIPRLNAEEIRVIGDLPPHDFDQQFLATMDICHTKDIRAFEIASNMSQDPQVKQFASDALPTLKEHRRMVISTASQAGVSLGDEREAQPAGARLEGENQGTTHDQNQGATAQQNNTNNASGQINDNGMTGPNAQGTNH